MYNTSLKRITEIRKIYIKKRKNALCIFSSMLSVDQSMLILLPLTIIFSQKFLIILHWEKKDCYYYNLIIIYGHIQCQLNIYSYFNHAYYNCLHYYHHNYVTVWLSAALSKVRDRILLVGRQVEIRKRGGYRWNTQVTIYSVFMSIYSLLGAYLNAALIRNVLALSRAGHVLSGLGLVYVIVNAKYYLIFTKYVQAV